MRTDVVARSAGPAKLPPNVDGEGKSGKIKLKPREGDDLSTREVFEKVGGAVYVVKAERKMGSAVAISEHELLTNCHVVGESTQVTVGRRAGLGAGERGGGSGSRSGKWQIRVGRSPDAGHHEGNSRCMG